MHITLNIYIYIFLKYKIYNAYKQWNDTLPFDLSEPSPYFVCNPMIQQTTNLRF